MTDRANIAIAINYKIEYGFSISVFKFDFCLSVGTVRRQMFWPSRSTRFAYSIHLPAAEVTAFSPTSCEMPNLTTVYHILILKIFIFNWITNLSAIIRCVNICCTGTRTEVRSDDTLPYSKAPAVPPNEPERVSSDLPHVQANSISAQQNQAQAIVREPKPLRPTRTVTLCPPTPPAKESTKM